MTWNMANLSASAISFYLFQNWTGIFESACGKQYLGWNALPNHEIGGIKR